MHHPKFFTLLACTLMLAPLHAQPSLVVTLDSIRDRVRSQNPDLAAARLRIQEAAGRLKQAGRLDNPELDASFQHNPAFNEGEFEIGISQRFPLTNRLQLEKDVSLTEVNAAQLEVRNIERHLAADASASLVEILSIRQRLELLEAQNKLTNELAKTLQQAAEAGEGSPLDAGQARMEALRAATEIRQLGAAEAAALGKLKPLLGMRSAESLTVSGTLPNPVLAAAGAGADPNRRPDYRVAKLETQAAAQNVALEQARRIDDVEGGFFTGIERSEDVPNGRENEGIIGVRFKMALPFWNKNEGKIEEAQARQQRRELETLALGRSIALEAQAALAEMREWAKLADEISTQLLPLADEQAEQTAAAYQTGQATLPSVLRAREQRLQLAATRLDALRQFHLARIRYESAIGQF